MNRSRVLSALVLGALVAVLTAGWSSAASGDPASANRGWDYGHAQRLADA